MTGWRYLGNGGIYFVLTKLEYFSVFHLSKQFYTRAQSEFGKKKKSTSVFDQLDKGKQWPDLLLMETNQKSVLSKTDDQRHVWALKLWNNPHLFGKIVWTLLHLWRHIIATESMF